MTLRYLETRTRRVLIALLFVTILRTGSPVQARQVGGATAAPTIFISGELEVPVSRPARITLTGSSVRQIRLRVFPVDPLALLRAERHAYGAGAEDPYGLHPRDDAGDMEADLRALIQATRPALVVTATMHPESDDSFTQVVPLSLTGTGAYVVVADGDGGKARAVGLLLRTDLRVTRRAAPKRQGGFVYQVTDSRTGRRKPGVTLFTRDAYALTWAFKLSPSRGELPQPQPLDSIPAPKFRYLDATGVTDAKGRWRNPRAPFTGQGEQVSLAAGTPMVTDGFRYAYSQTVTVSGKHFGVVAGGFWEVRQKKR